MRVLVKLIIATVTFLALSCHNDVPSLPETVKYCGYGGECKSTYYEISEEDCLSSVVGGQLFLDSGCMLEAD
jgi:hypothetical protein